MGDESIITPMGFMAGRYARVLAEELAEPLALLVTSLNSDSFYWDKRSPPVGPPVFDAEHIPRVLVKLQGEVTTERISDWYRRSVMTHGRLVTVEFRSEEWLKRLADLIQLGFDPLWLYRIEGPEGPWWSRLGPKAAAEKRLAPQVLALLVEMKRHSQISETAREQVHAIAPEAEVVNESQVSVEQGILRWLVEMDDKHRLRLKGLNLLGDVPPASGVIRDWFLAAPTKAAFFETVRAQSKVDLKHLTLRHFDPDFDGTVTRSLDMVLETWSEADFRRYQAATKAATRERP